MRVKTNELTGDALDWAVTKLEAERKRFVIYPQHIGHYSTDWAQGGPIIERERIDVFYEKHTTGSWCGSAPRLHKVGWRYLQYGPTPLIAAMRVYVCSKLGDEVEVPDELIENKTGDQA